ncbi:tRNA (adenosine(37)-N6)-threonylcarbamoyltransferase complex dimerization subunit type 1 TsaB [Candidatus Curtissbacteria bacterium RBG_13_35_7]|uniref:tRNA (Adenosine(37)-N6)-threonylcarbamoyltransferase complex dimerization subunit type 1 TsaB n=1 Tax=Candidatus Curtissbacteria bacterium RBG_13_35_7 TaxID=1797705 RepID=A0A1F5G5I4_9BACT|nr:MAG: tRNA (adenosine(37)-N6)-threonylcarbamoyltransferase complex dimerization subunit type 1 TsaB [Candidatus Curtissbacteria bacterium RBG_13_35_7]
MTLKIDTTDTQHIIVELIENCRKIGRLSKKQQYGSQVLLPQISKILNNNNIKFKDLTEIKVNTGPGSFTGTRIGIAVANALGFALNIPINGKRGRIVIPKYIKSKFD